MTLYNITRLKNPPLYFDTFYFNDSQPHPLESRWGYLRVRPSLINLVFVFRLSFWWCLLCGKERKMKGKTIYSGLRLIIRWGTQTVFIGGDSEENRHLRMIFTKLLINIHFLNWWHEVSCLRNLREYCELAQPTCCRWRWETFCNF